MAVYFVYAFRKESFVIFCLRISNLTVILTITTFSLFHALEVFKKATSWSDFVHLNSLVFHRICGELESSFSSQEAVSHLSTCAKRTEVFYLLGSSVCSDLWLLHWSKFGYYPKGREEPYHIHSIGVVKSCGRNTEMSPSTTTSNLHMAKNLWGVGLPFPSSSAFVSRTCCTFVWWRSHSVFSVDGDVYPKVYL